MIISPSFRLDSVQEYYFSKKLREIDEMNKNGSKVINLGIGSPDLPPPLQTLNKTTESIQKDNTHGYQSYKGIPKLRNAFASWYRKFYNVVVNPESEVLPLIGSKEGIFHISMAFINPGDEVLIPDPGYPTYASVTKLVGGVIMNYPLKEENNWLPDFVELQKRDLSRVKLMWVNYPHMPTGTKPTMQFFKSLIEFGRKNKILICNDNPYSFILNDNPLSILSIENAWEVALELNSLSKSYNMPGWRIGMVLGAQHYITAVLQVISNIQSGMLLPLQEGAIAALEAPKSWFEEINGIYKERRRYAWEIYDELGCDYNKDQSGLFVWGRIPELEKDSLTFSEKILIRSRVFVTPGQIFGNQGSKYLRISLCADEEIFKDALNRIKNKLSNK